MQGQVLEASPKAGTAPADGIGEGGCCRGTVGDSWAAGEFRMQPGVLRTVLQNRIPVIQGSVCCGRYCNKLAAAGKSKQQATPCCTLIPRDEILNLETPGSGGCGSPADAARLARLGPQHPSRGCCIPSPPDTRGRKVDGKKQHTHTKKNPSSKGRM